MQHQGRAGQVAGPQYAAELLAIQLGDEARQNGACRSAPMVVRTPCGTYTATVDTGAGEAAAAEEGAQEWNADAPTPAPPAAPGATLARFATRAYRGTLAFRCRLVSSAGWALAGAVAATVSATGAGPWPDTSQFSADNML